MKNGRKKWMCMDCGVDTGKIGEHYVLIDSVWLAVHNSLRGMLCVGCAEARLGRSLGRADFKDCYINKPNGGTKSLRLMSRLYGD